MNRYKSKIQNNAYASSIEHLTSRIFTPITPTQTRAKISFIPILFQVQHIWSLGRAFVKVHLDLIYVVWMCPYLLSNEVALYFYMLNPLPEIFWIGFYVSHQMIITLHKDGSWKSWNLSNEVAFYLNVVNPLAEILDWIICQSPNDYLIAWGWAL